MPKKPKTCTLELTVTVRYEADPEKYCLADPVEMAVMDEQLFREDPGALFGMLEIEEVEIKVVPVY